jgi:hypothetical protein
MMASIILIFSLAALLQFFVSYCRSLIAASAKQPLSFETRDVIGITVAGARSEDFSRVVQLLQLCPERPNDRREIRAVRTYFGLLSFLNWSMVRMIPSFRSWTEKQRAQCAYFVAVALDRRIAFSRNMLAAEISNRY